MAERNKEVITPPSNQRHWLYGLNVGVLVVVAVVIVVFLLYLTSGGPSAHKSIKFWHKDWTTGGVHSLSGSTQALVKEIDEKNNKFELATLSLDSEEQLQQVNDLLQEYASASSDITFTDYSNKPLSDLKKKIRTLYAGELKPYQETIEKFGPLSEEIEKFYKAEGANLGAIGQEPNVSPETLQDAAQLQGMLLTGLPRILASARKAVSDETQSTTPDWTRAKGKVKDVIDDIKRQLSLLSDPAAVKEALAAPEPILKYFTTASGRYKAMLAKVTAYEDALDKLAPLAVDDVLGNLAHGAILVVGPNSAKVLSQDAVYRYQPQSAAGKDSTSFEGEQAVSSALLSMVRTQKVKVVFVSPTAQQLTTGEYSAVSDTLRDANFDVLEWSPPTPPANPDQPPTGSPTPPAEGQGVVWIIFPPDAPNQQQMMMGMPPPNPQPVIEAAKRHLAAGGSALFLAEAGGGMQAMMMGDAAPGYAYDLLLKPFGIDVQTKFTVVRNYEQDGTKQIYPRIAMTRYPPHEITTPLESLQTVFMPLQSRSGGFIGLPTIVSLEKTMPATVTGSVLVESPDDADHWGETNLAQDATYDKGIDYAPPCPMAVAVTKAGSGAADKGQRIVVIGCKVFASNDLVNDVALAQVGEHVVPVLRNPGNPELFQNSVLWLAGYENMISVSAKASAAMRIHDISPGALAAWRAILYAGAPAAALLLGAVVWFFRRK